MADEQGAIPEDMKAWAGGESAPDDYAYGMPCLLRNGLTVCSPLQQDWRHVVPEDGHTDMEVIAYTPAADRLTDTGDYERRNDIRWSIISPLDDDPYANPIILGGTDWDIVLEALATPKPPVDAGAMENLRWIVEQCVRLVGDEAEN